MTKEITYSYHTSENASRFGFLNGCYTITIHSNNESQAIQAFRTLFEAKQYTDKIDLPYCKRSL